MIRRIDLRGAEVDPRDVLPRAALDVEAALDAVRPVCDDVRQRGSAAVLDATERFDGVRLASTRVPREALDAALAAMDPQVRAAVEEAARRARLVHEAQARRDAVVEVAPGGRVTERWLPVRRVGLYVPGGLVAYPSSVVMNVVPALVAGVGSLAVASPPQREHGGLPHPAVLAACALLGVDEVHAVGGAQAVAMFAYGTEDCERVDLVTGPGNIYVTSAKRLLKGVIGIDSEAGPTEIGILADSGADPAFVAADLIAQAEHDPNASCLLVTDSAALLDAVDAELARQVPLTRHRERVETALANQSAHVLVADQEQGLAVMDEWAPEHLEVLTADARRAGAPGAQRRSGLRRPLVAGEPRRLPGRLQPRAADGRHRPPQRRPVGAVVPAQRPRHRVRPRGAGRRRPPDRRAGRRRGPRGPRGRGARAHPARGVTVTDQAGAVTGASTDPLAVRLAALPLRDDLRGRTPYGAPQLDVAVRLNVNENPFAPSADLVEDLARAVAEAAHGLNRYPDRDATALRGDLAAYLRAREGVEIGPESVWAANGSNEVMLQLLQAFGGPGRTALGFTPTYSMYPDYCRDTFTGYVTAERADDFGLDAGRAAEAVARLAPDVVLLASPNNPTGTALALDVVEAVLAAGPGMVIVDEAYAEFRRPGSPSALTLLGGDPRLVVTRTMSKAFAFAGARVGYLAADPAVVAAVQLVRLPYHLSALTQAAARTALAHASELLAGVDLLRSERDDLVAWLRGQGLTVADTDANFALFGRFADRHAVWRALLDRGVLIRETGPDGWLRVSVGAPEENQAFRTALAATLGEIQA